MSGTNGHSIEPPVPPAVAITEAEPTHRCFKCESVLPTLQEFVFGGVVLCEPCYRETVAASETAAAPKRRRRKKHVPIAPAGTVPSGEVEWTCTSVDPAFNALTLRIESVMAQTWFAARSQAMALFACGPEQVLVVRA